MIRKALVPWALAAFAITNVDDLFLLTLFFAGKDRRAALRVVIGQYLGFTVLLSASVLLGLAGSLVPGKWIALLGLVPLSFGIRDAVKVWRNRGSSQALPLSLPPTSLLRVASITIANGGDNLAVYIPVFAVLGWKRTAVVATLFYIMLGVWCFAGWILVRHRALTKILDRIGHILLPVALIFMGLAILRGVL